MSMTPVEVVRARGWCQGSFVDSRGRVCLVGAVTESDSSDQDRANRLIRLARDVIAEQWPDAVGVPPSCWNDMPHRTQADVELVLEKAQARYDEEIV